MADRDIKPDNDATAKRVKAHSEGWRIGMCEGAAAFRKALLWKLDAMPPPQAPEAAGEALHWTMVVLAEVAEIDAEFRNRFGDEYDRQLQLRTKDG